MRRIYLLVLALALAFTACGQGDSLKEKAAGTSVARQSAEGGGEAVTGEEVLKIYLGEVGKELSPFSCEEEKDRILMELLYSPLLARDRSGEPLLQGVSEPVTEWKGKMYSTPGIADITVKREKGKATYTIALRKGLYYGEKEELNAKDLLFNYYLRFDPGYRGSDKTNQVPVAGLEEYLYGTRKVAERKKQLRAFLASPSKSLKSRLRQEIVEPVLEQELEWVESLYQDKSYRYFTKRYRKPVQLFAYFYSLKPDYKVGTRSKKQVLKDIQQQYSWNYRKLAQVTGNSYDDLAQRIALGQWMEEKGNGRKDRSVTSIEGISVVDDHTISIQAERNQKGDLEKLCDILLVPMESFGDPGLYQPENGKYGFLQGDIAPILQEAWVSGRGSGAYYLKEIKEEGYLLHRNGYYWKGKPETKEILLESREWKLEEQILSMESDKLDIIWLGETDSRQESYLLKRLKQDPASWKIARRQEMLFHTKRVNATSLPENMTEHYSFWQEAERVKPLLFP